MEIKFEVGVPEKPFAITLTDRCWLVSDGGPPRQFPEGGLNEPFDTAERVAYWYEQARDAAWSRLVFEIEDAQPTIMRRKPEPEKLIRGQDSQWVRDNWRPDSISSMG